MIVRGLTASWAERMQGSVTATDHALADLARLAHPAVRWWWGARHVAADHGAYCYLCERLVARWDSRWPVPQAALREIITHRDRAHVPVPLTGSTDAGRVPRRDPKQGESAP